MMDWIDTGKKCKCGSGKNRIPLVDAKGIFCEYVCSSCKDRVSTKYRTEVLNDPDYWSHEPIDEE